MQRRLRVPRPPAGSPHATPRQPLGHPARLSAPRLAGLSRGAMPVTAAAGFFAPQFPAASGGWRCAQVPGPAGLRPGARSGRGALCAPAHPQPPRGGKFALPAACSPAPSRTLQGPRLPRPRGQGRELNGHRPSSPPRPQSSPREPGTYPARRPRDASRRLRCVLVLFWPLSCRLAGRRGRPVRRHRPVLPARTCPGLPADLVPG